MVSYVRVSDHSYIILRACLHGGWGPQLSEVTSIGEVTHLSI